MAKFAQITYGTHGDTPLYTYVVNDNVRTGDYIQPSVRHYISGKIFGTTGIVQNAYKETSTKGMETKQKAEQNSKNGEIANAYTGKEAGAVRQKDAKGQFAEDDGLGKTKTINGVHKGPEEDKTDLNRNSYIRQTREYNVKQRENNQSSNEQQDNETYESYTSNKNDKGE
jgi:hypothetical protein